MADTQIETGADVSSERARQSGMMSGLRDALQKVPKYLLLLLGLAGLAFILYVAWQIYQFLRQFNEAFDLLTAQYGVNKWLAKAIAIVLVTPMGLGLKHSFWSTSKNKRAIRLATAAYAVVYCLAMFAVGRTVSFSHSAGEVMQWYAETPEGVRFFDSDGFDPKFGIKLKPVTSELKLLLAKRQMGQVPKRISIPESGEVICFDPLTGEARCWYYQDGEKEFDLFDAPGFHPGNGEPLLQVTHQIAPKIREWVTEQKSASQKARGPQVVRNDAGPRKGTPKVTGARPGTESGGLGLGSTGAPSGTAAMESEGPKQPRLTDQIRPVQVDVASLPTIQSVEAREFVTDIKRCRTTGTTVICDFIVTNVGADRGLNIQGWATSDARMIDESGNEYETFETRLGSHEGRAKANLVSSVPVRGWIKFEKVSPSATSIALLEIHYREREQYGLGEPFIVTFKGLPIAR